MKGMRRYSGIMPEFRILMFLADYPACDTATEIVEKKKVCKSHVSVSLRALT